MNKNKTRVFFLEGEKKKVNKLLTKQLGKNLEINQTVDARDLSF